MGGHSFIPYVGSFTKNEYSNAQTMEWVLSQMEPSNETSGTMFQPKT